MNYNETIEYIHSIPKFRRPLGNANLQKLLNAIGNPHRGLKYIHIAGTNGKGSTAAMLGEILKTQGYKTGVFTSPFIEVFNERIQINGNNITDDELSLCATQVREAMEKNDALVSEFAFICAAAFLYFSQQKCDFVVLETGMGGRLDATNVIEESIVSILCSISLDHMQFLGEAVGEIALEKCGIIKNCGYVVSYPNDSVREIIEEEAKKQNAQLSFAKKPQITEKGFVYDGEEYMLALKGEYQPYNAAVVLEAVKVLKERGVQISSESVRSGLINVRWPVRFEFVQKNLVIDGAHNSDAMEQLKKSLEALDKEIILVMAMMEDKSCEECVKEIAHISKYFIATQLDMPRCLDGKKLLEMADIKGEYIPDSTEAVKHALKMAGDNAVVCVCGSLYLAGDVRKVFKNL